MRQVSTSLWNQIKKSLSSRIVVSELMTSHTVYTFSPCCQFLVYTRVRLTTVECSRNKRCNNFFGYVTYKLRPLLYGEYLFRAEGSPFQPSQLERASI